MTVATTTNKISYTGNGSTTVFAYNYRILTDSDLQVYVDGTLKSLSTHYTVSGAGDASGGNVTFTSGNTPPDTKKVVIIRNMPQTQATDYVANDPFPAETHEEALDKLTMIAQDVQKDVDESFRFASTVTDAGTITIDKNASDRASLVLAFDSSGNLAATQELGEHKGNWAASTAYVLRDIVKDTNNNNQYICIVAHTSSGSVPISTNTDAAKWRLLVDAASATTSATAAASSATAAASSASSASSSASTASTQASNASSSASTASTQASNASSSASTASTAATNASNSATAAASSATSAAASADTVPTPAVIKDGTYWGYTTSGSANTYTLTTSPAISGYAADMFLFLKFNAACTGASTINLDSRGAKNIKKSVHGVLENVNHGDIDTVNIYHVIYDGTQFVLTNPNNTEEEEYIIRSIF